jgi:hypothetical protein
MALFSTATASELPPWLLDMFQGLAAKSQQLASAKNPESYQGQRLAELPPEFQNARTLGNQINSLSPYLRNSEQMVSRAQTPFTDKYREYMNPYEQRVVSRIAEEGNRNLKENILPELEARFIRLGQHGSSRHADLSKRAARDIQSEISANQAKALAQGYQQSAQIFNADQARGLESAREMSALGGLNQAGRLADIAMLMDQGRYHQQQDQAGKDLAYQDFLRRQNFPWEMLQNQAAVAHGMPLPQQSTQLYQTPGTPQLNVPGQVGTMATNLLGTLMSRG